VPDVWEPAWLITGPILNTRVRPTRALAGAGGAGIRTDRQGIPDQLTGLKSAEKTPPTLSASFTLQAVRFASRLICVALRFVFSVL
jgi:hypothetical protein